MCSETGEGENANSKTCENMGILQCSSEGSSVSNFPN